MQCIGMGIDKIENAHHFYQVWYHPLWKEALKGIQLSDNKDSPLYSSPCFDCTSSNSLDPVSNLNPEDTMHRYNSKICEKVLATWETSLSLSK
jgi:hypothetical protein